MGWIHHVRIVSTALPDMHVCFRNEYLVSRRKGVMLHLAFRLVVTPLDADMAWCMFRRSSDSTIMFLIVHYPERRIMNLSNSVREKKVMGLQLGTSVY